MLGVLKELHLLLLTNILYKGLTCSTTFSSLYCYYSLPAHMQQQQDLRVAHIHRLLSSAVVQGGWYQLTPSDTY